MQKECTHIVTCYIKEASEKQQEQQALFFLRFLTFARTRQNIRRSGTGRPGDEEKTKVMTEFLTSRPDSRFMLYTHEAKSQPGNVLFQFDF